MNYADIQSEVITFRFSESRRASVKNWINQRYAWIWGQCDWSFRNVSPANFTVVGGSAVPVMPTDLDRVRAIYNSVGDELEQMLPSEFDEAFETMMVTSTQGIPVAYKVVNRIVTLGPIPSSGAIYQVSYERLLAHKDTSGNIVAGPMSADSDQPIWDAGHHYMLVIGAMSTGLKMENDPTWQALEQEFAQAFQMMQEDLLPADRTITTQFGADSLC